MTNSFKTMYVMGSDMYKNKKGRGEMNAPGIQKIYYEG